MPADPSGVSRAARAVARAPRRGVVARRAAGRGAPDRVRRRVALARRRRGSRPGARGCCSCPVAAFVALAVRHDRVIRARDRSAAAGRLLRARAGAHRGPLDRHRRNRRPLPQRPPSLRQRSRPLRAGLALRAAVARAHAHRRGHAGGLADRRGATGGSPRAAGGRAGTDRRARHCARSCRSPSAAPRRAWTRTRWRAWAEAPPAAVAAASCAG